MLEVVEQVLHGDGVVGAVEPGDHEQPVGDVAWKVIAPDERLSDHARLDVPPENEIRERRRVAADRRVRLRRACIERPARRIGRVVAGDEERLHRGDRPAPRIGRPACVPALPIARGGATQRLPRLVPATVHEQTEPSGPGCVRELRQLALVELALPAALVPRDRCRRLVAPAHVVSLRTCD